MKKLLFLLPVFVLVSCATQKKAVDTASAVFYVQSDGNYLSHYENEEEFLKSSQLPASPDFSNPPQPVVVEK